MEINPLYLLCGTVALFTVSAASFAEQACPDLQQKRCTNFCQNHQGMQSCVIDMAIRSGTCTCNDGAQHSKNQ